MLAMFIGGWIFLPVFALWDLRYAKRPVIARRFLANRTVVCAAWIGFFDFVRASPSSAIFSDRLWLIRASREAVLLFDVHVPLLIRTRDQALVRGAQSSFVD